MTIGDLSLKGILREHLDITPGDVSVRAVLAPLAVIFAPAAAPDIPLRPVLEGVARTEQKYKRKSDSENWTAKHEQTWTHMRVRVKLKPKNQAAQDALDSGLDTIWKVGIESFWNDQYSARRSGELGCRLSFEVNFTDNDPHYTVHVEAVDKWTRSDMTHWDTLDEGHDVAHEYGHMLGKFDEYVDVDAPDREPVSTGTVMDDESLSFSPRQFTRFAQNLGCFVCDADGAMIPKPY